MSIDPQVEGRAYPPVEPYQVTRERIREFAQSVKADHPTHRDPDAARALGHPDLVAPPTFAVIMSQRAEKDVINDPDAGIDFSRVVHADQRFTHQRPICAGDEITAAATVESVTNRGGISMITTRVDLTADGAPVSTVRSTYVVRSDDAEGGEDS